MFTGFTPAASDFLWGIRFNNYRDWFMAHKQEYLSLVQQPLKELAREVFDRFTEKYPDLNMELHVSRIYRDARRLHGKGPYKDHLWFSIQSGERRAFGPMFWFEIGGTGWSCGAGNWEDSADVAEHWRRRIDAETARFERIVRGIEARGPFVLYGEAYKRPKADKGELLNRWYNRKHLGVETEVFFEPDPPGPELVEELMDAMELLMPLYDYYEHI